MRSPKNKKVIFLKCTTPGCLCYFDNEELRHDHEGVDHHCGECGMATGKPRTLLNLGAVCSSCLFESEKEAGVKGVDEDDFGGIDA